MSSSTLTIQYSPSIKFLRSCAVSGLDIALDEQCFTDQCVCGLDLPSVLNAVSTAVDGNCATNRYDATSAMFAVIQYCTVQGYSVPSSLASITTSSGNTQTLSVASGQDTPNLPSCAQFPFFEVCDMIGCTTNNCFCRPDIMQSAMASMSVSVGASCSGDGGGVQSAMQAVESYCVGNGFAVTGVTSLSGEPTGTAAGVSSFVLPGTFSIFRVNSIQHLYAERIHPSFKALLPTSSHPPPPPPPPPPRLRPI